MAAFKEGDQVQLKSGGPQMTVMSLAPSGEVICQWFVKDDVKTAPFKEVVLKEWKPRGLNAIVVR